jgi:BMFP domain-containing protein YqiC
MDPRRLDDLARRVTEALPEDLGALSSDLERNVRAALQAALRRMDLVTREEFDVQAALLARTREKLEALEQDIARLEAPSKAKPRKSGHKKA